MQRTASVEDIMPVVLVVDDDPDLTELLSRFLSRQGMKTFIALNGAQCLEIVERHPDIDVIVLDVMMPGMDGLQVCATLKQMKEPCRIPIILLTARDDISTRLIGVELGVSDFVVKPISGHHLIVRIRTQVEARRKGQSIEKTAAAPSPTVIATKS
jgi:DNA-binding response OmpR family regulator